METISQIDIVKEEEEKREIFFERFINDIKVDKLQLDTKTASNEVERFYSNVINGNIENLALQNKSYSNQYFISKIILDFLELLKDNMPNKLAFDYNGSEVLVWAEISDDDFEFEKKLILAEAKINAKYHAFGFDMTTSIVETSDNIAVPTHFKIVK